MRLTPKIVAIVGIIVLLAFISGPLVSKAYWGYWLDPPAIDSRVMGSTDVSAFGGFETAQKQDGGFCDRLVSSEPPNPKYADPTEYPSEYTSYQMSQTGLSVRERGSLGMDLQKIRRLLLDPRVQVKGEEGYDPTARFYGFWARLKGSDGEQFLFVAATGSEVSNDHYPYYRLLYLCKPGSAPQPISRQVFYYDIAGLERMRWYRISLTATILGLLIGVPVVLLASPLKSIRTKSLP